MRVFVCVCVYVCVCVWVVGWVDIWGWLQNVTGLLWVRVKVRVTEHLHHRRSRIAWVTCASVFILLLPPPENAFISLSTCSLYVACPQSKSSLLLFTSLFSVSFRFLFFPLDTFILLTPAIRRQPAHIITLSCFFPVSFQCFGWLWIVSQLAGISLGSSSRSFHCIIINIKFLQFLMGRREGGRERIALRFKSNWKS